MQFQKISTVACGSSDMRVIFIVIYALAIGALVPIIQYVAVFELELFTVGKDRLVAVRTVLSGPMLIIVGVLLVIFF